MSQKTALPPVEKTLLEVSEDRPEIVLLLGPPASGEGGGLLRRLCHGTDVVCSCVTGSECTHANVHVLLCIYSCINIYFHDVFLSYSE